MPRKKPITPSQLPRISLALGKVEEMKGRLLLMAPIFAVSFVFFIAGTFKPLTVYFHPAFPWISIGIGAVLFLGAVGWLFDVREFMQKSHEKVLAFVFGVVFVVVLLAVAFFVPNPTAFQYTVFRIVLALAAAGVAAMIPGFLQVNISTWLRAGGALAIFVIVYFYAPAALESIKQ